MSAESSKVKKEIARIDISKSGFMRDGLLPFYEIFEWLPLPGVTYE